MANRVLLLGGPPAAHFFAVLGDALGATAADTAGQRRAQVETKYYTATLELRLESTDAADLSDAAVERLEQTGAAALLLCVDPAQPEGARPARLEALLARELPLALCVLHSPPAQRQQQQQQQQQQPEAAASRGWLDAQRQWCVEHGLELVEPHSDEPGEAAGLDRVLEALRSTLWPQHTRRPPAAKAPAHPSAAPTPATTPATPVTPTPAPALAPTATQIAIPPQSATGGANETAKATPVLAEGASEEQSAADEARLSTLLEEVGRVRAQARDLPDAERRALAARTALQFAALLGLGDDDDDEA